MDRNDFDAWESRVRDRAKVLWQEAGQPTSGPDAYLDEARELGLRRVFALTYKPEFFARFGFQIIDRNMLPHKVWGECIKCHKFPNCNEIAMMYYLDGSRVAPSNG